jgi:tetratricopeptide (TPR) repeat protein
VSNLLGVSGLPRDVLANIVRAAGGNPLYAEQMLSMLVDNGALRLEDGVWRRGASAAEITVPPTIHALLEARLDKLGRYERATVEPASVIGVEFGHGAVESLAAEAVRPKMSEYIGTLTRKQFIRPTPSTSEDARYRFHHHLVRDTVYNGLLKRSRAQLHVEFVRWADKVNAERQRALEFEEILGYHLEQAHRYLRELGPLDEQGVAIAGDAARRLSSAGRRAAARGDMNASANLYRRAVALLDPQDPRRLPLLPELAETLIGIGDFSAAREVLDEAGRAADACGDHRVKAASALIGMFVRLYSGEQQTDWSEATLRVAHELIPVLQREEAHNELATAWRLVVLVHGIAGHYTLASSAVDHAIHHARLAGNDRLVARNALILSINALYGSTPVPQAIAQCEQTVAQHISDRQVQYSVMCTLAQLKAMNGELDAARGLYRHGRAMLRDLGQGVNAASTGIDLARVELLGGDLALAEREMREDYDFLAAKGETYFLSTMAGLLSRIVRDQGRDDEALALSKTAEAATASDDVESQALWRAVRAPILARQGDVDQAVRLAREAVELTRQTEAPTLQADALAELACVLRIAGQTAQALDAVGEAVSLYRAKGNLVQAARWAAWS